MKDVGAEDIDAAAVHATHAPLTTLEGMSVRTYVTPTEVVKSSGSGSGIDCSSGGCGNGLGCTSTAPIASCTSSSTGGTGCDNGCGWG